MISAVIQDGGNSKRMGKDKSQLPFKGYSLIQHVVWKVEKIADEVLIISKDESKKYPSNTTVYNDIYPGKGVLGGLYTGLKYADFPIVLVVACDMPFLNLDLLTAEKDLLFQCGADVVIPRSPKGMEPLHAFYRKGTCLPEIERALNRQESRLISWLPSVNVRVMTPDEIRNFDPNFRSFINLNTPDEFYKATREVRENDQEELR